MLKRLSVGILATVFVAYSGAAFAIYSGVSITGVDPDSISSATISLPGQPATNLTKADDCENDPEEDCPSGFAWYYSSDTALTPGTSGTMSYLDAGGNRQSAPVTVGPGGTIGVDLRPRPAAATDGPSNFAAPFGGYYRSDVMPINMGADIDDSDPSNIVKTPLVLTNDSVNGWSFGGVAFFAADSKWKIGLEFNYAEADASGQQDFAAPGLSSGQALGWLYDGRAMNGSTGITTGFLDLQSGYQMDLRYTNVRLLTKYDMDMGNSGMSFTPFAGIQYGTYKLNTVQNLVFDAAAFGDGAVIRSDRDQVLKDTHWGLGVGINGTYQPSENSAFRLGFGTSIWANIADHNLRSMQMNVCSVCGPDELAFNVDRQQNRDPVTFTADLRLNAEFAISPAVALGVYGRAKYMSDMPSVTNPLAEADLDATGEGTNEQGGPQLGSDDGWSMQLGGYFGFRF